MYWQSLQPSSSLSKHYCVVWQSSMLPQTPWGPACARLRCSFRPRCWERDLTRTTDHSLSTHTFIDTQTYAYGHHICTPPHWVHNHNDLASNTATDTNTTDNYHRHLVCSCPLEQCMPFGFSWSFTVTCICTLWVESTNITMTFDPWTFIHLSPTHLCKDVVTTYRIFSIRSRSRIEAQSWSSRPC